jgi:VIT1/CCC1 family predicted Fe2+/Mn2+ transporter
VPHRERHRTEHIGWLRAAVMGANDGIVSTASLVLGVAASGAAPQAIVVAGVAGLVAGAMSMAAGEYVSVSSQADTERADLERERRELATDPESELNELAGIWARRGLDPALARQVAVQLTAHDALAAHARDELGRSELLVARPVQAALASAASFAVGAGLPLAVAWWSPPALLSIMVAGSSLLCLAVLGGLAAYVGGAGAVRGALRVTFWGALAMAATAAVGSLFGVVA